MSTAKLTGILTDVFPIENFPNFSKKVFWLKQPDTERYPQHWELELHGQDWKELNGKNVGDVLECEVEVRGKKYKKRDTREAIILSLKCVGMRVVKRVETTSGKVGSYKPTTKPGREPDDDRPQPQTELPL